MNARAATVKSFNMTVAPIVGFWIAAGVMWIQAARAASTTET